MNAPAERNIRAVTFDAGGTLIEPFPSVGEIYRQVAAEHGWTGLDAAGLSQAFLRVWKGRGDFGYRRSEWARLVSDVFQSGGPFADFDGFFDDLYERFGRAAAWRILPGVPDALDELKRNGMKLGIISNWDERLRPLLADLDLARYFDSIVVSIEAGAAKPARAIFERSAAELAISPDSIVHVGDSEVEDCHGARSAGFSAMLLTRGGFGERLPPGMPEALRRLLVSDKPR